MSEDCHDSGNSVLREFVKGLPKLPAPAFMRGGAARLEEEKKLIGPLVDALKAIHGAHYSLTNAHLRASAKEALEVFWSLHPEHL